MLETSTGNRQFEESLARIVQILGEGQEPAIALQSAARSDYADQLGRVSPIVASVLPPELPGGESPAAVQRARLDFTIDPDAPLVGLGPLFQWGHEFALCLMSPTRGWLQPLVQSAEVGLTSGARDLRARGLQSFRETGWDNAIKFLSTFTQQRDDDGIAWRMLAFAVLCKEKWDQARTAYAVAARLTEKTLPIFSAECHLLACFAARQMEDWDLTQQHSEQGQRLLSDFMPIVYEYGAAGICRSRSQEILTPEIAHQTRMDAVSAFREVLRDDCRFAVRLETDPGLGGVHDQVQILLQELHSDMARDASGALAAIRTSIVNAEYDCTAERFGAIAAQPIDQGKRLADVYARNSVLDFADVIRRSPEIQDSIQQIRTMIRTIDDRMQEIMQSYNVARQVVDANEWPQVGSAMEERLKHLRQLHSNRDIQSYQQLQSEIPEARTAFYQFAAQRLKALRGSVNQSLAVARSVSQRLNQKATNEQSKAAKPPFRMEGGFLYWLVAFFLLRSGLPQSISISPTVLTVIAGVVSAAAIIFLHRFLARQRILHSHAARREAAVHDREIFQPLSSLVSQIDQCADLCARERPFTIPPPARSFISPSSSKGGKRKKSLKR